MFTPTRLRITCESNLHVQGWQVITIHVALVHTDNLHEWQLVAGAGVLVINMLFRLGSGAQVAHLARSRVRALLHMAACRAGHSFGLVQALLLMATLAMIVKQCVCPPAQSC